MLQTGIRMMFGLWFQGNCRWKPHFLQLVWTFLLAVAPLTAVGYFLGDTKAVLNGCQDQWTLQSAVTMPRLFQITVCVDVHVVVPGAWVAFLYTSVRGPNPDLGLEGDATAVYGWLLQVRHRFPLQLAPMQWHRVCLRRDAEGNTFSLEVNGRMEAERTVIAQAIPPSGTLWLGCHPRLQPPGVPQGKVELYLFRMWADLNSHGFCEDGTVIGWDSQFWSVTSSKAKEKDPYLLCEIKRFRREAGSHQSSGATIGPWTGPGISRVFSPDWKSTPSTPNQSSTARLTTPPITTAANQLASSTHISPSMSAAAKQNAADGSVNSDPPVLKCDTRQLCSNDSAYFWMSVTAQAEAHGNLQDVVCKTFVCDQATNTQPTNFTDFCRGGGNIQVLNVSCSSSNAGVRTTCGVLLLLNGTMSACDLQLIGESALQQSARPMMSNITVEVERVGQNLCKGLSPSTGRFVTCMSTSSLEDICRSNAHSSITCSVLEPDFQPLSKPGSSSCSKPAPRFCDCAAFCKSTSHFYAMKLNISKENLTVETLKEMFLQPPLAGSCSSLSPCHMMLKYQAIRLECHGTSERLHSCMVTVEMSGPVDECALKQTVQTIMDKQNLQIEMPLTRMMVCGPAGSSLQTLLESNYTWVTSDLQSSDMCQADPTLPLCEAGETLAVLLTDICPPQLHKTQPPSQSTTSPEPTLNNTTNTQTTTLSTHLTSKPSATSQPVLQTNTDSIPTAHKNVANTTPLPPPHTPTTDEGLTKTPNQTTVSQSTREHNKQSQTIADSTADINTTDPNDFTTGDKTSSSVETGPILSQHYTTQSTIPSLNNNYTTEKNEMTTSKDYTQHKNVTQTSNNSQIFSTTKTSNESTEEHTAAAATSKHTTIGNAATQANNDLVHTTATPSNMNTTPYSTTPSNTNTTLYSTTPSNMNTTPYSAIPGNMNTTPYSTTPSNMNTTPYSTTPSNKNTTPYSATPGNINTTPYSTTLSNMNTTPYSTTPSNKNTTPYSTTPGNMNTTPYSTTPSNMNTTPYSATPGNINTTPYSATPSNMNTTPYSATPGNMNTTPYSTTPNNNETSSKGTTQSNNDTTLYTKTHGKNNTINATTALERSASTVPVASTTSIINGTIHPTVTKSYTMPQSSSGATETATTTLVPLASYTHSQQSTSTKVPFNRTGVYNKTESYTTNGPFTPRSHTTQNDTSTTNISYTGVQFLTTTIRNSSTLHGTTTKMYNTTKNSSEITDEYIKPSNATPPNNNSLSEPTSPPPDYKSTTEYNYTTLNKTPNTITAYTTAYPETTATQNHTTVHNFTNHSNNSALYSNLVTAEKISTLAPTASHTDSQQMGDNYTQENNGKTSKYTTGVSTPPNSTKHNNVTSFNSYTTVNNLTIKHDISITTSQISTVTHNTTTFINKYTTTESPTSISKNLNTESNTTTPRNIYTKGYYTTGNNDTTPSNNLTTYVTTLSSNYTTGDSTMLDSDNTIFDSKTTGIQNYTTAHNFSNVSNERALYTTLTPTRSYTDSEHTTLISTNYTQEYNESKETSKYTTESITTPNSDTSTFNNDPTATQNYTTAHNFSNAGNSSVLYNTSTTETISTTLTPTTSYTDSKHTTLLSTNYTQEYNESREASKYTTSNSDTTTFNSDPTATQNNTTAHNFSNASNKSALYNSSTTETISSTLTPTTSYTDSQHTTFLSTNYTQEYNGSQDTSSYTTINSFTTENDPKQNVSTPLNSYTTVNVAIQRQNPTTTYNTTTNYNNFTKPANLTLISKNVPTDDTTRNSSTTKYDTTGKSNTTVYATTPSNNLTTRNHTLDSSPLTHSTTRASSSYTIVYNTTTTNNPPTTYETTTHTHSSNSTVNNTTTAFLGSDDTADNETMANSGYTTPAPALTSDCPNKTITCSQTVAPTSTPQHFTKTVSINTTVSPAATQKFETMPTKDSNVDILKSNHTTEPPQVSMSKQTTDTTTVNTNMYFTINGGSIHKTTKTGVNAPLTTTITTNPATASTTTAKAANAVTSNTPSKEEAQLNTLSNITKDPSQLNVSQISDVVKALDEALKGPSISKAIGQKALEVISNLLDANLSALSGSSNRLIRMVERLGVVLEVSGDTETLSTSSLELTVRTVDGTNFVETSFQFTPSSIRSKRAASLPGSVFLPSSLTSGLTPKEQLNANRVQFMFYTKNSFFQDILLNNQTTVSQILGTSVANLSISNLKDNISFTISNPKNQNFTPQITDVTCVFWDYTLNGEKGGWRSDGCFVVNVTDSYTICSCNHLTSFAVLLDLSRQGIMDKQHAEILTYITYIGCGISSIFLSITLLTYLLFPILLRDIPAKILVQLSLSLLLLNLVFLLNSWLSLFDAVGLCISTAFFLHYFLLTSFTWAGLEALHMYLSIIRVFTPYLNKYMLKFSLMGWGIPLIVVVVVIAVDKDNYGPVGFDKYTNATGNDFCWLRNETAFYVGVVAYFLLVFVLCLLVFIVVMYQLSRIKKQNPQNQSPNRSMMTDMRSIIGLVLLLGLTWGFALFAWGPLRLPFFYLFSIFNSLLGFFLFVFHCAVKENVRRQWRIYFCCGKLRLPENQDWSRKATNNKKNTSVATATTSNPMSTSRGSVISDVTNSSGSAPADSGISGGSNNDVLLNDIHTTNPNPQSEA
ncbi:adhesion G-protein coupled receptor G2 isoform X2 [Oryzias latipes]|uniref:adhesion G-protein coupled receptor G2 isoform X2 n=1 Tax=Oryzias latipes TaxID=8090 RepID=UPI000CE175BC|nr:adhesion G-protein coupled receptor G2 isoform X2 [Oryzias latipes]